MVERYAPPDARCRVFTFKDGLLSPIAHDLEVDVGRFSVEVDREAGTVSARFEADSLRVLHPVRDGRPDPGALGEGDLRKIERTIRDEVLQVRRFATVTLAAEGLKVDGDRARAEARLTLHGVTRPLALEARCDNGLWVCEVELQQPDYGIRPYTAMLGTLKIKAALRVRVELGPHPQR